MVTKLVFGWLSKKGVVMDRLNEALTQRLEKKGLSPVAIPGFIRNVANTMSASHRIGMEEMNKRLHLLGWDTVELDYQTLELIIASPETSSLKGITDSLTKVQVT